MRVGLQRARAVADAVLYEGYLLYPYRRSSAKNRVRWQFGVLAPREWVQAHVPADESVAGSVESWWQQTECLLQTAGESLLLVDVRFLQVQARQVLARTAAGSLEPVDRLDASGAAYVTFDEAVEHEQELRFSIRELLEAERTVSLGAAGAVDTEVLRDGDGKPVGEVRRVREPVLATVTVSAQACPAAQPLARLRVRTANAVTGCPAAATREAALRSSLVSTHTILAVSEGCFVSLLDPPEWARDPAQACRNVHTFPVLAGAPGERRIVLSSPIILYDHARIAPESPGDLHDATEIDEILSLRTLTLTDEEKREARASDPRAGAIVDRVDALPPEAFARLHGAIRSLRPAAATAAEHSPIAGRPATPWWDPGADAGVAPETDAVTVKGRRIAKGARVRLRPRRRGADPHDMFLDGRTAMVEGVFADVDGGQHVAVSIEGDPLAQMYDGYQRFRYFRPDEVDPIDEDRP